MNKEKNIINDENKNYGNLTLREKIPSNQINNIRLKIFTNSFPMNQNKLNETNSKIKKFNLNNNIRHLNKIKKNKFSKSKNDLTLEHTSRLNKNINTTITSETANKYLNSFIIIDDILQKTKGDFFENKNKNTIRKPKLSIKLKKLDTFSIDNEVFNFTERRDNINLNIKNLENLTKSNLNKKQTIKNNLKKLNLKYLLKINNISKIDNTLPINYQRNLQTQRNKPSKFTIFQNNKNIFNYLNTDIGSKNSNILSNLDKNNIGHIKSKELFSNYIRNNNRIYSNDIRNNINKTSDSIKINNDSKKKKFLQKFKNIENLHNKYFKMINKNDNTYIKNLNCSKYNTIDNKFIDTSRIKRKKINLNGNNYNNNDIYIFDINKNKISKKITQNKIKNNRNMNNNNNIFDKYLESRLSTKNNDNVCFKNINNIKYNHKKLLIETKKKQKENNKINNKVMNYQDIKKF